MKIEMLTKDILKLSVTAVGLRVFGLFIFIITGYFLTNQIMRGNFEPWWTVLFNLLFPLLGLAMMFLIPKVNVVFDKSRGMLTLNKKNILNTTEEQFNLSEVKQVVVQSNNSGTNSTPTHRLVILMESGSPIPVTTYSIGFGYNSKAKTAQRINDFLSSKS